MNLLTAAEAREYSLIAIKRCPAASYIATAINKATQEGQLSCEIDMTGYDKDFRRTIFTGMGLLGYHVESFVTSTNKVMYYFSWEVDRICGDTK